MAEVPLKETISRYTANQTPYTIKVSAGTIAPLLTTPSSVPSLGNPTNDITDINFANPMTSAIAPMQLPIRGEKRFIPENALALLAQATQTINTPTSFPNADDFSITAALPAFTDYVVVIIPHRGKLAANGLPDTTTDAVYRFLINPQTAQIGRATEETQAFTRAGWQFGLWGEGLINVSMTGHTPGQYFAYGLTDEYAYFSESWRNLQQLVMVFENNGYWFEGEEANEGPLAPGFTRRRIKKHQDVQLVVGNHIWWGMFDELSVSLDAEHPFRAEFRISFLAWKERFRKSSPYANWGIQNNVERGHSYGASTYPAQEAKTGIPTSGQLTVLPLNSSGLANQTSLSPAVYADQAMSYSTANGYTCSNPNSILFDPGAAFGGQ